MQIATSIVDYIFRYLSFRFLNPEELNELGLTSYNEETANEKAIEAPKKQASPKNHVNGDTVCKKCGGIMVRTGTCLTCLRCGDSSGGCS